MPSRRPRLSVLAAFAVLASTLVVSAVALGAPAGAQATDLIFTQYMEGTSFNKAIEIANVTGAPVDLTGYQVELYSNGNATANSTSALSGTLADGDVHVLYNSQANAAIMARGDASAGAVNWNGDDAIVLRGPGGEVLDSIGQVGFDPGTAWDVNGVSTLNQTLCRDEAIEAGDTDPSDAFDPSAEWISQPVDDVTGLGYVGCSDPAVLVVNEIIQNPAAVSDAAGEWFELYNPTASAVDIDGWTIRDDGTDSHTIDNGGPLVVPAGGFLVLGNNADAATNGGVAVDYSYGGGWFLGNGDDEVVLEDPAGTEVDRVDYDGGPVFPDPNGASMSLDPDSADIAANDDGANWCEATSPFGDGDLGTPGAANDECEAEPPAITLIHDVQGSGPAAAITGPVAVQGIVTGLFERFDVLDGFFLQEEDADADADPATSEGIFLFCRANCPATVAVGDQVTATGNATEFQGLTEIDAQGGTITIDSSGNPLPTPVPVSLPAAGSTAAEDTFENLESMHVVFPETLAVSEYFEVARAGHVVLVDEARPYQYTHSNTPDPDGYQAFLDDLATRRIFLDDDNNDQNDAIVDGPDEAYYYPEGGLSLGNKYRGGDTITGLGGVMHWSWAGFGSNTWRIRPIPSEYDYTFTEENPTPAAPGAVGGDLRVASFNVLNYFTTIDTTSSSSSGPCGPSGTLDCRGADSDAELARQRQKAAAAIIGLEADVVGLIEIENNASASLEDLVDALNSALGAGSYDYVDTGTIGTDAIKVGFIYQPARVTPVGPYAILDSTVDPAFVDDRNRPALIQTFEEVATGERFTAAVNHLKSKGSGCDDLGDPDLMDGQGSCPETRRAAAQALADYLATDPTGSGDPDFLIIGDLNSYAMEPPITTLEANGFTNLVELFGGADAYSYVFDGQLGYLDHALANASLTPQVTGVTEWHINADEVPVFDYNDDVFDDPGEASFERETTFGPLFAPNPLRSSDHDPVLIGLDLQSAPPEPVYTCGIVSGTVGELEAAGYEVHIGTDGNDVVDARASRQPVFVIGLGGVDWIRTGPKADVVCAGEGVDLVATGAGGDYVDGGPGFDVLSTDGGADTVLGGEGSDLITGGSGNDDLSGGPGADLLFAGLGKDALSGGPGRDLCDGGLGRDTQDGTCEIRLLIP